MILIARWAYYTDGDYTGKNLSFISQNADGQSNKAASRKAFEFGLGTTLRAYQDAGVRLTLISQVPQQLIDPLQAYGRVFAGKANHSDAIKKLSVGYERHRELQHFADDVFARYDVDVVDFSHILCEDNYCPIGTPQESYYFDEDHLSVTGARRLLPSITKLIGGAG